MLPNYNQGYQDMLPKTRCLQTKWKRWLWRVRLLAFVPIELSGSIRLADHKHWRHTNLWVIWLTFKTYLKCSKKRAKLGVISLLQPYASRTNQHQPTSSSANQLSSTPRLFFQLVQLFFERQEMLLSVRKTWILVTLGGWVVSRN